MKKLFVLLWCIILIDAGCKKKDPETIIIEPDKPVIIKEPDKPVAFIYVANENRESVSVIDIAKMRKIKDIDISDITVSMVMPHNVQVALNGKTVWVTGVGMIKTDLDQVIVINPLTNEVVKRIYIGENLHLAHIVLDSSSKNAFVTAFNNSKVFQIDAKSFCVIKTFDLDSNSGPHGLRYSNGKLYVASMTGKRMDIIDIANNLVEKIPLGGIAVQTAVTLNGKYVFISLYDTKEVIKYNIESKKITRISLPSNSLGPIQIYPTPDGKNLYVCDQGALFNQPVSIKVFVIDIEKELVTNTIITGKGPHGVVISNDGKYACVTSAGDNNVYIIETKTNTIKGVIPAGPNPNGIGYWYGSGGMP